MQEFWKIIPTKLLIALTLIAFIFIGGLIWYAVVYQNNPVEILGVIKLGERSDELRKQLLKARADIESRVAPETYNAVLSRLKEAESKISHPSNAVDNLKAQLKQREDRINQLSKELAETRMALESVKRDLQLSRKDSQELTDQLNQLRLNEVNMRLEGVTGISKQKSIEAFSRQLSELAKEASGSVDSAKVSAIAYSYNEILVSLKKELPTDSYIQTAKTVNPEGQYVSSLATVLRTSIPQLRAYLEQRYLK